MAGDGFTFPGVADQAIAQNPGGRRLFYTIPIMQ